MTPAGAPRVQRRGWRLRIGVLVAVVAIIAVVLWVRRYEDMRRRHGWGFRQAQMDCLASIHAAQERFKSGCYVDQDGDGDGEYGTLSELAGLDGRRTKSGKPTGVPLIPPELGLDAWQRGGIGVWKQFCFRVDLPTGTGMAACAPGVKPTPQGIDRQEELYLAYAWGAAGVRPAPTAVALPPDGTYRIRSDWERKSTIYMGSANCPAPGAAMSPAPPRPPFGQSVAQARAWHADPEHTRPPQVDDLEGEFGDQSHLQGGADGAQWLIGSDGWVGTYGRALPSAGWQARLNALLAAGLPRAAPPLVLPTSPGAPPPAPQPAPVDPAARRWLSLPLADRFVILLRCTGAMGWEWPELPAEVLPDGVAKPNRMVLALHQLEHLIAHAGEGRRFHIVLFNGASWQAELAPCTAEQAEAAIAWVEEQPLAGADGTMEDVGLKAICAAGLDVEQIVLVTNGLPGRGAGTSGALEAANTCGARIDLVVLDEELYPQYFQPAISNSGGRVLKFP